MRFSLRTSCLALLSLFASHCHLPTIAAKPPSIGGAHRQKPEMWNKPAPSEMPASPSFQAEKHSSMASLDPDTNGRGPPAKAAIGKWGFAEPFTARRRNPSPADSEGPIIVAPPGRVVIGKDGFAEPYVHGKGPPAKVNIGEWPLIRYLVHSGSPPARGHDDPIIVGPPG